MVTRQKIWFFSEVYYPDEQGTAFYTTGLAEGLAKDFRVGVLCNYPTVTARGSHVPAQEVRNNVHVERCRGTTFNKDIFTLRLINIVTYSISLIIKSLVRIRRGDIVIVVTSPPSVPFIARLVASLRRAHCILRLEDVYPEVLVATGMLKQSSPVNRFLELLNQWLYRNVDLITVLGRDMKKLAEKKTGGSTGHIRLIRSWADTDIVFPLPRQGNPLLQETGLSDKFVVSCVGNMGRAQAIESIMEAVNLLKDNARVHFLFIGSGAKKKWLEAEKIRNGLTNVTLLDQRPREDQANFLNACELSIISLLPGMTGAGVPSRTYNIMAAGKPIIALTSAESEVSLLVREENIGWVVHPDNASELVQTILQALSDPDRLRMMGERASAAAREKFSRERIVAEYHHLVSSLILPPQPASNPKETNLAHF